MLPGLTAPAEIVVDTWGVPHIYGATTADLFLVQGFNAARERLWQIDFWRRRGLGLLSEAFGPAYVENDRAARLFVYRGEMDEDWPAYGSDAESESTSFVTGVNAFIQLTRDDPRLLPVEFTELGYEPGFWETSDIARIRSNMMFYNLREEVARARVVRDHGSEIEELRRRREPHNDLTVPEGLDVSRLPDDVLSVYDLVANAPIFAAPDPLDAQGIFLPEGSNNWVIAGSRTATGRPILANDPHRVANALPGLRYLAHLSGPDFDVIGAGEPGLPGLSIGHNGHIAFGLTTFAIDQEDLYVYELNPDSPREYRYQGGWETMRIERSTVEVRGADPVEVEMAFTRHGPVIHTDEAAGTAFAVRAAWLGPGMAPYLGSLDYMRARNWDEYREALNGWGAPPLNQVYADTEGNIAWQAVGRAPIRPNWDGTLPVPGDGRYEWAGFYDTDDLPGLFNPERGWVSTANEMNLPEDFPADRHITYDWYAPHRKHRIDEALDTMSNVSVDDMFALSDYLSIPARRIVAVVEDLLLPEHADVDGLPLLTDWDGVLRPESASAAFFEVWYRRHLRPAILSRAVSSLTGNEQVEDVLIDIANKEDMLADARVDLELIEEPGDRLGPDPESFLTQTFLTTIAAAITDLDELLGSDRATWRWGRLHVARATHPLRPLLTGVDEQKLVAGPIGRGGSGDTVGNTAYGPNFVQTVGSTFRIAVDVGNWDASLAMNAPGQSGNLDSPHHTDLFEPWAAGQAFPLLYTRGGVESVSEHVVTLVPPSAEPIGRTPNSASSPSTDRSNRE